MQRGMATKLGWFAVRNTEATSLVPVLERLKEQIAIEARPNGFSIIDAPPPRPRLVDATSPRSTPAPFATVMPHGWTFTTTPVWAEAVSKELEDIAISFVVFGGTWSYAIFDRGERLLEMDWTKDLPVLQGDAAKAARALEVDEGLFERYRAEIELVRRIELAVDEDDDEAVEVALAAIERRRPFRGDTRHPSDEWAHLDFSRRLGRISEPAKGVEIDWSRPLPAPSARDEEAVLGVGDGIACQQGIGEVVVVDTVEGNVVLGIRLSDGGTRTMPRSSLRPLMNAEDLRITLDVLREPEPEEQSFGVRFGRYMDLVKIGTGPALAEVVRDLSRKVTKGEELSFGEKRMLEATRSRLVAEVACVRQVSIDVATTELIEASRL